MATIIKSIGIEGIEGYQIAVQVKILFGLPKMNLDSESYDADVEQSEKIEKEHIHSALLGRDLDKVI